MARAWFISKSGTAPRHGIQPAILEKGRVAPPQIASVSWNQSKSPVPIFFSELRSRSQLVPPEDHGCHGLLMTSHRTMQLNLGMEGKPSAASGLSHQGCEINGQRLSPAGCSTP